MINNPNLVLSPQPEPTLDQLIVLFAVPGFMLLATLIILLVVEPLVRRSRGVTTRDFRGVATVTRHEYIPSRRTGTMVHSTSSAKYLIFFTTEEFSWRINSEDLYHFLEDGDQFELEGRLTTKRPKLGLVVPVFESFKTVAVRKLPAARNL